MSKAKEAAKVHEAAEKAKIRFTSQMRFPEEGVSQKAVEAALAITLSSVDVLAAECLHESDVRELLEAALPHLTSTEASAPVQPEPDAECQKLAYWIEEKRQSSAEHPTVVGLNPEEWDLIVWALRRTQPSPARHSNHRSKTMGAILFLIIGIGLVVATWLATR